MTAGCGDYPVWAAALARRSSTLPERLVALSISRIKKIKFFGPQEVSHRSLWTISELNGTQAAACCVEFLLASILLAASLALTRVGFGPSRTIGSESALVVGAHKRVLKKMWPVLKRIRPDLAIDERGFLRNQNPHGGYWCPSESEVYPSVTGRSWPIHN